MLLACAGLSMRLIKIPGIAQVAQNQSAAMRVVVDRSRGAIYDRSGNLFVASEGRLYAAVKPTPAGMRTLQEATTEIIYTGALERLRAGNLVAVPVQKTIESDDAEMITVYPRYQSDQPAAHILGYLDGGGKVGKSGLEKSFNDLLEENAGSVTAVMSTDAGGNGIAGSALTVTRENYLSKAGVQITIDREIQEIVEKAMRSHDLTQGAVVVLDAKTSEIRALASTPTFDPNNLAASLNDPAQPFVNRALSAYPMGSTFKCVVAAAALEQGILPATRFTCTGAIDVSGQLFHCIREEGHGEIDMTQALASSCNCYFIQLAQKLDKQQMLDLAQQFGFGQRTKLAEGLSGQVGNLPSPEDVALPGEWANLSFGQGTLLSTPLQTAVMTAAIVSGGTYRSPSLIKGTLDESGVFSATDLEQEARQIISTTTANEVKRMMIAAVEIGTCRGAKPTDGTAGGKTATAQSGIMVSDGEELMRTAFTGFFPADEPQYVVAILKEVGTSGSKDCIPVFKAIAEAIG
jgi:penicillin-binding protein 2